MAGPAHVSRVRFLYKRLLVLQPVPAHRSAGSGGPVREGRVQETQICIPGKRDELHGRVESYRETLQTQVLQAAGGQLSSVKYGSPLQEDKLGNFQSDQIGQLYELMLESTKSSRQFDIQEDGK
ncbi:hypothetical protein F7725_024691 [Dissostichus mawsoni]|uniref:Succinate dehydrogenase assembly factor 3, mitochondrial n=1 Tax=Dissostichus mawsoni TaxID=36200 RepID=A0A7J5XA56_DISMA|nr:hypothetical protein F7725_024691 [Dissostichus mawsoni]